MLRIRMISTAAATAIALALAASGASAQSASSGQPGTPLSLLQLIKQTSATAPAAHADSSGTVAKTTKKVAGKKHNRIAAQAADPTPDSAQSSASADAWLAASATPANSVPAMPPADAAPALQPGNAPPDNIPANDAQTAPTGRAQADDRALPSAVVVGGQTVQVAAADQVNEIDLAADNAPITQPNTQPVESTAPRSDRADDRSDVLAAADDMAKAAMAKAMPSRAAFVAAPEPADAGQNASDQTANDQNASAAQNDSAQDTNVQATSAVGSASWIAQVLAALGGAIAAGTVAWFLIGAGPVRTYG